jgi:hypothetical protein
VGDDSSSAGDGSYHTPRRDRHHADTAQRDQQHAGHKIQTLRAHFPRTPKSEDGARLFSRLELFFARDAIKPRCFSAGRTRRQPWEEIYPRMAPMALIILILPDSSCEVSYWVGREMPLSLQPRATEGSWG